MTQILASNVLPLAQHISPVLGLTARSKSIEIRSHADGAGLNLHVFVGGGAPLQRGARENQPQAELRYAVEFYRIDESQRCWEVLKCTHLVRQLAQKKCEVEVLQAMNEGGDLDGCTLVRCAPWVDKPLKVETLAFEWKTMAMPSALKQRCTAICSQLGATEPLSAPPTDGSPDSLRQKVRYDWAERFYFEVEVGSAHEIAIALASLQQEIEALEAELAVTSTT